MKKVSVLLWILFVISIQISRVDAECSEIVGNNYLTDSSLELEEDSGYGFTVVMPEAKITCGCGIITRWIFYARKNGTVVFFAMNGTVIVGSTKVHVPQFVHGGGNNHYVIPLSQPMWIPVKMDYHLAFYSEHEFQITYKNEATTTSYGYYSPSNPKDSLQGNNGPDMSRYNRKYAVAAYVEEAHPPMFVNAPYETTIYTHEIGTVVYTATVLDIDGTDVLTVTWTSVNGFSFDGTSKITYTGLPSPQTVTITVNVDDGCPDSGHSVSETVKVNIINARPKFVDLPKSTSVSEDETSLTIPFKTNDDSGDAVTCSLNPTVPGFLLNDGAIKYTYTVTFSGTLDFDTKRFYELTVVCTDVVNSMTSNIQVDVIKNRPPYFVDTIPGFIPAFYEVDRDDMRVTAFNITMDDPETVDTPEVDGVTPVVCESVLGGLLKSPEECPFTITSAGVIKANADFGVTAYDIEIKIKDTDNAMSVPYYLSVVASKGPFRFNESPKIINLPTTIKVMEGTPADTYLFKLLFTDENPADNFKVTANIDPGLNGHLKFNTTTYLLTTGSTVIDFENPPTGKIEIIVEDGTGTTQFFTVSSTITIEYGDVNEDDITLVMNSNPPAKFYEDRPAGSVIYNSVVNKADTLASSKDTNEVIYYWMDCGEDSKYFWFEPDANTVKLVREYDMDKGLSGSATCNITARDTGGFTHTKSFNITIEKRNDIVPKFLHKNYVFFQRPSDTFFTLIANMSASDADIVDTPTVLTYRFGPAATKAATEFHFQIDEDGILYIRNVTTIPDGSYKTFEIIVSDNDVNNVNATALEGTCTVTVIFSGVATTTTTTTERNYVYVDDYENYWWMFLVGVGVFAAVVFIIFIVCNDPRIYDYVVHQMNRFAHWCRRKPKPKVPRRTVGKLTVTVNKKKLENDPDNALPWELLAKDGDVPEINQVQADIEKRKEKRDRDYKNFKGLPIFEKGKGARPDSAQTTSSTSSDHSRASESPKYATFVSKEDDLDKGGEGQWGELEGATGGK